MPVAARGKKKALIVIGVLVLLVLALAAGAAVLLLRSKAAHANAGSDDEAATTQAAHGAGTKNDPAHPPTFLPLERQRVRIRLRGGRSIEGELRWIAPAGRRRTADCLNDPLTHVVVNDSAYVSFIAKAHIAYAEEL